MNITLSADPKLIQAVREYAVRNNTSLNELVREHLQSLSTHDDHKAQIQEAIQAALSCPGRFPDGWKFNREEAHRRESGVRDGTGGYMMSRPVTAKTARRVQEPSPGESAVVAKVATGPIVLPAGRIFVDTNVWVYAVDERTPEKQKRASAWLAQVQEAGHAVVSIQVFQEFGNVVIKKRGLDASEVFRLFSFLERAHVVTPTVATVRRSVELCCLYQVSFWDACILAAAEAGNCRTILSEDFQIGRSHSGIRVVNPFA